MGGAEEVEARAVAPRLGVIGWLRFVWRRLTSMSTALVLLLLLALAAIPGSLVPQRQADPNGVSQFFADNPDLAQVLDRVQLFDVYSSAWFSAIYILLFVSLIGCVVPRIAHHWQALRSSPPRTPARLGRLPESLAWTAAADEADTLIKRAESALRKGRYRVARYDTADRVTVSAERGYLRESGNLVFHIALIGVLVAVAVGGMFTYYGQKILVVGQTFANSLAAYDSFSPGALFDADAALAPFALTLDSFEVDYETQNVNSLGAALEYRANVSYTSADGDGTETIRVNHPLTIADTEVFLMGNGFAPHITVRDASGAVVFSDPVPFLPQDANLTSLGVVKVPDAETQLGMIGFFYPTRVTLASGALTSLYPDLIDPVLTLNVYAGDLGLDDGVPRSVYTLDTDDLTQLTGGASGVDSLELAPGETTELPDGLGTVTFDSVDRFVSLELRHDPTQVWVLVFVLLAVAGLILSLLIPRRRLWVAVTPAADGTRVEVAGLARGDDPTLAAAVARLAGQLGRPSAHDDSATIGTVPASAP